MSDFEAIQGLVTRLEWIDLALKGTSDKPGLLDQLERLLAGESPDGGAGLVERIEGLVRTADQVVSTAASVQEALATPVDEKMQQSIEQSIREAINRGAESLDERAKSFEESVLTLQKVGSRASEQMVQSVAQAELVSRSTQDAVSSTRDELDRVSGQVAGQLEGMLKEVSDMLSPEALRGPLRDAAKEAIQGVAVEADVDELKALHKAELRKAADEIKADHRQYQDGFQDELVEIQREASERVRKIIAGRGPSQAIIDLYDKVEALGAENESLKKQDRGQLKGGGAATPNQIPKHIVVAIYAALIASGLSLWLGVGGTMPL